MKTVLYHPRTLHERNYSAFWLPYSILSVGSAVTGQSDVTLVDNNLHQSDSHDDIVAACQSADVLGISVMIGHQIKEAMEVAATVKQHRPDVRVVIGGAMGTMMPEELLTHPAFDYVVRGQGATAFSGIISSLNTGAPELSSIPGLSYRKGTTVLSTPNRPVVSQSLLPRYDFSLTDPRPYIRYDEKIGTHTLNYVASQGCPFGCGFCSDTNLFYRRWSSSNSTRIADDVTMLVEQFGVNGIKFYDSNFFVRPALSLKYAELLLERSLGIRWGGAIHPAA